MSENGEEKYARLSGKEMYDDIDKLRRENGWKPRRRGSTKSSAKVRENATASPAAPHTQAATPAAAAVGNSLQQQQQQSTMVKNSSKQSEFSIFHQISLVAQQFRSVEFRIFGWVFSTVPKPIVDARIIRSVFRVVGMYNFGDRT